jgi:hypothetical protein
MRTETGWTRLWNGRGFAVTIVEEGEEEVKKRRELRDGFDEWLVRW